MIVALNCHIPVKRTNDLGRANCSRMEKWRPSGKSWRSRKYQEIKHEAHFIITSEKDDLAYHRLF